ncbi:hypothetical protein DW790_14465 [Firmicutes bacterium AM31-12AC]|nr:hypothetical protein DW790_14465 [Firmicutes bacterium AM31-12AC]
MSQDKRIIKSNEANENLETLKKEKRKTIYHIIIIAIVAIIVIIALCIAWFVSNTRVKGTGATISADMKSVELKTYGSAGIHDDLLKKIMAQENPTGNSWYQKLTNAFLETSPDKYSVNWLLSDQSKVGNYSNKQLDWEKYWKDSNNKREDYAIEPGSNGRLQFSVVPKTTGNITLNMQLSLIPYKYQDNKLKEADETTKTFTSGHILFFLEKSGSSNAGNESATNLEWISNGSFTLNIPDAQKDKEYSYTLYWCWPQNFAEITLAEKNELNKENEFLNGRKPILSTYANGADVRDAIAYADSLYSMVNNPQRYFYSNLTQLPLQKEQPELLKIKNKNMQINFSDKETKDAFVALSSYYNQADQYIGSHANCLRVKLEMQPRIQD